MTLLTSFLFGMISCNPGGFQGDLHVSPTVDKFILPSKFIIIFHSICFLKFKKWPQPSLTALESGSAVWWRRRRKPEPITKRSGYTWFKLHHQIGQIGGIKVPKRNPISSPSHQSQRDNFIPIAPNCNGYNVDSNYNLKSWFLYL